MSPSPQSGALTPYIIVKGAVRAIQFYTEAFGARELYRLSDPTSGKIGHAELAIGTGKLMLADEYPDWGAVSPASLGGTPVSLHLYVSDVDTAVQRATDLGATVSESQRMSSSATVPPCSSTRSGISGSWRRGGRW